MHSPPQCVEFHLSVLAFRVGEGDGVGEVIRVERVVVVKSSVQVGGQRESYLPLPASTHRRLPRVCGLLCR